MINMLDKKINIENKEVRALPLKDKGNKALINCVAEPPSKPIKNLNESIKVRRDNVKEPRRDGNTIILPLTPLAQIYPLRNGEQFLYQMGCDNGRGHTYFRYWFGGVDENLFLVEIREDPAIRYLNHGEDEFYRALKPERIGFLEKIQNTKSERQGDIFAVPLNIDIKDRFIQREEMNGVNFSQRIRTPHLEEVKDYRLFETRHKLDGIIFEYPSYQDEVFHPTHPYNLFGKGKGIVGTGVIKSKDHAPLILSKGDSLFYIDRSANLMSEGD